MFVAPVQRMLLVRLATVMLRNRTCQPITPRLPAGHVLCEHLFIQGRYLGPHEGPWWSHVATVVETPLLSLLLSHAFPPTELPRLVAAESPSDDETQPQEASSLLHAN